MARPTLAVWKLASCDGCQLTLLDCTDELLALAAEVDIVHFTEATRTDLPGPYDVSLVEGSVTTPRTPSGSARSGSSRGRWSPSGPAPPRAASRRCATSPTSPSSPRRLRQARVCARRWPPPPGSPSTCRSTSSCAAVQSTSASSSSCCPPCWSGRKPQIPAAQRVPGVQAPRQPCVMVAHGTPVPRPGHPGGMRRDLPRLRPRLLRLLRPDARRQHRSLVPQLVTLGMTESAVDRVFSHVQRGRARLPRRGPADRQRLALPTASRQAPRSARLSTASATAGAELGAIADSLRPRPHARSAGQAARPSARARLPLCPGPARVSWPGQRLAASCSISSR